MKVTDAAIIKDSEQDLIDAINGDLDWGVLEKIFYKAHSLGIGEDVAYKAGDIVVHEGQVAYRLEFEVKVNLAVLLDRRGRYIEMAITEDKDGDKSDDPADEKPPADGQEEKSRINDYEDTLAALTENENDPADASQPDTETDPDELGAIDAALAEAGEELQKV